MGGNQRALYACQSVPQPTFGIGVNSRARSCSGWCLGQQSDRGWEELHTYIKLPHHHHHPFLQYCIAVEHCVQFVDSQNQTKEDGYQVVPFVHVTFMLRTK